MRRFTILALMATSLVVLSTAAFAHTSITRTSIPNNGAVSASPSSYTVTYGAPVRLATVTLVNAMGQAVPINFTRGNANTTFAIPLPRLSAGTYMMTFRSMGSDGHVMNNQTTFRIGATAAVVAASSGAMGGMAGMAGMNHSGSEMKVTTSIEDGAVLTTSPRTITLQFPHAMALTSARLTTASDERIAIQLPATRTPATSVAIPLPRLDADSYTFTWGADAGDHNMSGTVRFQVR